MNYNELLKETNEVYYRLQDDISRKIYRARVMNSLTYDYSYITEIAVDGIDVLKYLRKELEPYIKDKRKIILDGAGYYGKSIKMTLRDIEFECFSDKNAIDESLMGIPVLSRREAAKKYPEALFVVTSLVYDKVIRMEIEQLGVKNILDFGEYLNRNSKIRENQYYDVFKFSVHEIIADVGCFDCFSMMQYFKYANKSYNKMYSFEPEPKQYAACRDIISHSKYENWEIYNYGVCDKTGTLCFSSNNSCTKISDDGEIEVNVIRLDDFFKDKEIPTFIKMDIEGAELKALMGCSDIIRKYKPKLAICVYHKPEDIFEIPQYILSLNSRYKMYLRHYCNLVNETVLYCI